MNCNFEFTLNGKDYLFRSREDLSKFLYDNRNRLKLSQDLMVKYSLDFSSKHSKQSESLAILAQFAKKEVRETYRDHDQQDMNQLGEKKENGGNKKAITGTNVYKRRNEHGQPLVKSVSKDEFKLNQTEKWLKEKIYKTKEECDTALDELFNEWEVLRELGTVIHSIPEFVFDTDGEIKANEVIEDIRKKYPEANVPDAVIIKAIEVSSDIKAQLLKRHPDGKMFTEIAIETKNDNDEVCKGIIDLLVVDKDGIPHIYDFKTSSKNISQYNNLKTMTYDYQLAFYRHILGSYGMDISKTSLNIIPLELGDIDYENKTIGDIKAGKIDDLTTKTYMQVGRDRFNYLNSILQVKLPSFNIGSDFMGKSGELMLESLGYEAKLEANPRDVDSFIRNPFLMKTSRDGKKQYFYDKFAKKDVYVTEENKHAKVREYLSVLEENNINAASIVSTSLESYIKGDDSYFREKGDKKIGFDPNAFAEYVKTGWEVNTDFEHMGLILLYNPELKIVDVINITAHDITQDYKLSFGSTILGNYKADTTVGDSKIIKSNYGNIELLRSMMIVNDILADNSLLNGYKIGGFKVMSHRGNRSFFQNDEHLKHSFNELVKNINIKRKQDGKDMIKNHIKDASYERPEERIARIFQDIINKNPDVIYGADKHLESFTGNKHKTTKQKLGELLEELKMNGINVKTSDFKTPLEFLAMRVAEAYLHYSGVDYEYAPGDYSKGSFFTFGRGLMWQMPDNASDPITQTFQREVFTKRNQVVRNDMNRFAKEVHLKTELISKNSLSLASEWNMYDNLFEPGKDGDKLDKNFRLKNPYDPKSSLTNDQREYLKWFLSEVNRLMDNGSKGDPESKTGKEMIAAGTWFNVPLLYGDLANKITASGSIVEGVKRQWDQLKETVNSLEENVSTQEMMDAGAKYDYFEMMPNSMKMDPGDRRKILEKTGNASYSRDLGVILTTLAYKEKMAQVNNELMPLMRALLIFNNSFMSTNKTGADNLREYLVKYLQTQVFGRKNLEPDQLKIAAAVKAGSGVLAKAALSLNILSVERETLQGLYNNILNIATSSYSIDPPSLKDLAFGYGQVTGNTIKDPNQIGKLDCLAAMFPGILGSGIRSTAEELAPVGRGGKLFKGDMMMKLNMAPDRLNRLAPLIAFMKKDGIWDAMDFKDYELSYDWKKDKRFDLYVKYRNNENNIPSKDKNNYEHQRARYEYMISQFAEEGYVSKNGGQLSVKDDLPFPYIANEIGTLTDIIAHSHGHMSPDSKSQAEQTLYVSMATMFKSWLKTKVNKYTMKGGFKNQGQVMEAPPKYNEFNEKMYLHRITKEDGSVEEWWDTNPAEGITQYTFVPAYNQGILDSLRQAGKYYKQYGLKGGLDQIKADQVVKRNLKYLGSDLFAALILFLIGKFIFDYDELEKQYGRTAANMMFAPLRAAQDNNPIGILQTLLTSTEPPAIAMAGQWIKGISTLATSPSLDNADKLASNVAVYRVSSDLYNNLVNSDD